MKRFLWRSEVCMRRRRRKEWGSWQQYDSCEILSEEESARVLRECPRRVLPSRYVYRNKECWLAG